MERRLLEEVQHRLLLRGRHAFEDDLEVVDLGDAHAEVLGQPVADVGLAHPTGAADQQDLPLTPVAHLPFLAGDGAAVWSEMARRLPIPGRGPRSKDVRAAMPEAYCISPSGSTRATGWPSAEGRPARSGPFWQPARSAYISHGMPSLSLTQNLSAFA